MSSASPNSAKPPLQALLGSRDQAKCQSEAMHGRMGGAGGTIRALGTNVMGESPVHAMRRLQSDEKRVQFALGPPSATDLWLPDVPEETGT